MRFIAIGYKKVVTKLVTKNGDQKSSVPIQILLILWDLF